MSSLFIASSTSVLPINLFAYFSTHRSINGEIFARQILTYSTLFNFLRRDPKNRENLNHYLNDDIQHLCGRLHFCVDLETSEKHFDPFKDIDECVLACLNIFNCLRDVCVTMAHTTTERIHTERRTPTPAKTTLEGENSCHINVRKRISDKCIS